MYPRLRTPDLAKHSCTKSDHCFKPKQIATNRCKASSTTFCAFRTADWAHNAFLPCLNLAYSTVDSCALQRFGCCSHVLPIFNLSRLVFRWWPRNTAANAIPLLSITLWFSQHRKHSHWSLSHALTVEQMRYLSLCQVFIGQSSCCVCKFEYDPVYVHSIMRLCCATKKLSTSTLRTDLQQFIWQV